MYLRSLLFFPLSACILLFTTTSFACDYSNSQAATDTANAIKNSLNNYIKTHYTGTIYKSVRYDSCSLVAKTECDDMSGCTGAIYINECKSSTNPEFNLGNSKRLYYTGSGSCSHIRKHLSGSVRTNAENNKYGVKLPGKEYIYNAN